jgi:hypothetical protein
MTHFKVTYWTKKYGNNKTTITSVNFVGLGSRPVCTLILMRHITRWENRLLPYTMLADDWEHTIRLCHHTSCSASLIITGNVITQLTQIHYNCVCRKARSCITAYHRPVQTSTSPQVWRVRWLICELCCFLNIQRSILSKHFKYWI